MSLEATPPPEQLTRLRLPAAPFNMVGPIDAAWLVLGIIVVVFLNVCAPQVLRQGPRLFAEESEAVKEPA